MERVRRHLLSPPGDLVLEPGAVHVFTYVSLTPEVICGVGARFALASDRPKWRDRDPESVTLDGIVLPTTAQPFLLLPHATLTITLRNRGKKPLQCVATVHGRAVPARPFGTELAGGGWLGESVTLYGAPTALPPGANVWLGTALPFAGIVESWGIVAPGGGVAITGVGYGPAERPVTLGLDGDFRVSGLAPVQLQSRPTAAGDGAYVQVSRTYTGAAVAWAKVLLRPTAPKLLAAGPPVMSGPHFTL